MAQNSNGSKSQWGRFGKVVGLNLLAIVVLTVILLSALSYWLDIYTRHDEHIDVPSLKGIPVEQATQFLEEKGLKAMVIDSVYANQRPGTVIEQLPAEGLPVKQGRIVYLTINSVGVRMVKMQNVCGGGSRQALSTLKSLGFEVDSVKQVASDMDDLVLSVTADGMEMQPGREYPSGTRVVVHVGSTHIEIEPENEETEEAWME